MEEIRGRPESIGNDDGYMKIFIISIVNACTIFTLGCSFNQSGLDK